MSDSELIMRVKQKDNDALQQLFVRYKPVVNKIKAQYYVMIIRIGIKKQ